MSLVYLETDPQGMPLNVNLYLARQGFLERGHEVRLFTLGLAAERYSHVEAFEAIDLDDAPIIAATISTIRKALQQLDIPIPGALDYPASLTPFLGRKIWSTTLGEIRHQFESQTESNPVFIKPKSYGKSFTGHIVASFSDLLQTSPFEDDLQILASEVVSFAAEWRVFVLGENILDVRLYKGNRFLAPDETTVRAIVQRYVTSGESPAAFAADIGVVEANGKWSTFLVEVNDGYSLGTYGLNATLYAQMLEARWRDLTSS